MPVINATVTTAATLSTTGAGFETPLSVQDGYYFVVTDAPGSTNYYYSTNGHFNRDGGSGRLLNSDGYYLNVWPRDNNGHLPGEEGNYNTTSQQLLESTSIVSLQNLEGVAYATTTLSAGFNLPVNFTSANVALIPTYSASANNMASGTIPADFSKTITIVNDWGQQYDINMLFLKNGDSGWYVEITTNPANIDTNSHPNGQIAQGEISFSSDGTLAYISSSLIAPLEINWAVDAPNSVIITDFGGIGTSAGLGQSGNEFVVKYLEQNGLGGGSLDALTFADNGTITATIEETEQFIPYQIPLAYFLNPDGLTSVASNTFAANEQSGAYTLTEADNTMLFVDGETVGQANGSFEADTINGSTYRDILKGNYDNDVIYAMAGNDWVRGGKNNDFLQGNQGNDEIYGDKGDDTLHGGKGDDTLYGGEGNDTLYGDKASDVLHGGEGNDLFVFQNNIENTAVLDRIMDFERGADQIQLSANLFATAEEAVTQFSYNSQTGSGYINLGNSHLIELIGVQTLYAEDVSIVG